MKNRDFAISIFILISMIFLVVILNYIDDRRYNYEINDANPTETQVVYVENDIEEEVEEDIEPEIPIVYEGLTFDELVDKLNKNLHSDLSGTGYYFAKYSLEYGVDPYLAVAISLHESGCNSTCSYLVSQCNNVGGQKFKPSCSPAGSMGRYDTLEQGIEGFIRNIAYNYYAIGLNTAELMQAKYVGTGTTSWAPTVNRYIEKIRSS